MQTTNSKAPLLVIIFSWAVFLYGVWGLGYFIWFNLFDIPHPIDLYVSLWKAHPLYDVFPVELILVASICIFLSFKLRNLKRWAMIVFSALFLFYFLLSRETLYLFLGFKYPEYALCAFGLIVFSLNYKKFS